MNLLHISAFEKQLHCLVIIIIQSHYYNEFDYYDTISGKLHVVTEFCPGGALRNFLIDSRVHCLSDNKQKYANIASKLHHTELLKIAADVSYGMAHLSSQKVLHCFTSSYFFIIM